MSLLVAGELANGAVAGRLYIAPHTVNTRLRHVFAELGVPERVALAARGTSLDQVMSWPPAAGTIERMQCAAFAVRLLPGQTEAARGRTGLVLVRCA